MGKLMPGGSNKKEYALKIKKQQNIKKAMFIGSLALNIVLMVLLIRSHYG